MCTDRCERFKGLPLTGFGDGDYVDALKFSLGIRLPPESPSPQSLPPALGVYFAVL